MQHIDLIICDLEATCWEDAPNTDAMEIIEIGAVRLSDGSITSDFQTLIKPVAHPTLSDFCKTLTTITQQQVDAGLLFPTAYEELLQWIGSQPFVFCSWGRYDLKQLKLDVARWQLPWDERFDQHLNIKHAYARFRKVKPCGMEKALTLAKLPLEGTHHRGLDDARNIARITRTMLPWLLENEPLLQR
jgi:3'-5' exoribonuclease 1